MRHNMQESLLELSRENWRDYAYWPDGKTKQSYYEYLVESVIHTMYDNLSLDEWDKAKNHVGSVFFTEEEVVRVHEFILFFSKLSDDVIWDEISDEEIEAHPFWPQVRKRAQELYDYLKENDKKYNIEESWKLDGN